MNTTTFLLLVFVYIFAFMGSFLIDNKVYKIYYFLIIALTTITGLNIYFGIIYYIKLRNDPGMPGPRGPRGDKGPSGASGKCIINEKCGFSPDDAEELIYTEVAKKFDTTPDCLRNPTLENCGSATEMTRINKLQPQIKILKNIASQGSMTKQQFETKLRGVLFE